MHVIRVFFCTQIMRRAVAPATIASHLRQEMTNNNVGKNARVVTKMSETCKTALKMYAEMIGMNMGDVLYECTRIHLHTQAGCCNFITNMFKQLGIPLDKRAGKPCFAHTCLVCKHSTACKTGRYDGVVELHDERLHLVTAAGAAALNLIQAEAGQKCQEFPELMKQFSVDKMKAEAA